MDDAADLAAFEEALRQTIDHEGGWVLSRDADGAAVYCGVNSRANPGWPGWEHLPDAAPARPRRIDTPVLRRLVGAVYQERYWRSRICVYVARWPSVRRQVFDCVVNHGESGAVERLQEACQHAGADIVDDGKMGPATEEAIQSLVRRLGERGANDALVDARIAFYRRLADAKPGRKRYLKGWTRRAETYRLSS